MKHPNIVQSNSETTKSNSVQNPAPVPTPSKEQSSTPIFSVDVQSPALMNIAQQIISKADPAAVMLLICLFWSAVVLYLVGFFATRILNKSK